MQTVKLQTQVQTSEDDRETLRKAMASAFGDDVDTAGAEIEVASTEKGLVISWQVQGVTRQEKPVGEFNLALDKVLITTSDGRGTARVDLGSGLTAEGDAIVEVTERGIDVVIENPKLLFEPDAPDVSALEGGSDAVLEIDVDFKVGLSRLPDEAALSVQFAKKASELLDDSTSVLQLAAEGAGGSIENPDDDVAFLVSVTKDGITNEDLGANDVTMAVSKAWYDRKLREGKAIVIAKIGDQGESFSTDARCTPSGSVARCEGRFSGAAGGFSVYALIGVVKAIEEAQAPAADVAGDEPSGSLVGPIIGIVLVITAALALALVYRSRRRGSRQAPTLDTSAGQSDA